MVSQRRAFKGGFKGERPVLASGANCWCWEECVVILAEVGMVSEWQQLKDGGMCRDREKENDREGQ